MTLNFQKTGKKAKVFSDLGVLLSPNPTKEQEKEDPDDYDSPERKLQRQAFCEQIFTIQAGLAPPQAGGQKEPLTAS
ncbi:MAG: hypothetical protein IH995_03470 [Proteobacteria bacterium]|nr:hypothetical protein [Pseudomonadota bacterium]